MFTEIKIQNTLPSALRENKCSINEKIFKPLMLFRKFFIVAHIISDNVISVIFAELFI